MGEGERDVRDKGGDTVNGDADFPDRQRGARGLARDPAQSAVLAGLGVERVGERVCTGQGGRDGKRPDQEPSGHYSATG